MGPVRARLGHAGRVDRGQRDQAAHHQHGVLGGIVAFGFIGVFVGPVLLAIGYALAKEWSEATSASPGEDETQA